MLAVAAHAGTAIKQQFRFWRLTVCFLASRAAPDGNSGAIVGATTTAALAQRRRGRAPVALPPRPAVLLCEQLGVLRLAPSRVGRCAGARHDEVDRRAC